MSTDSRTLLDRPFNPLTVTTLFAMGCALLVATGCASTAPVGPTAKATAYDIRVKIDPQASRLDGQARLTLRRETAPAADRERLAVEFALNRGLVVQDIVGTGAHVRAHSVRPAETTPGSDQADGNELLEIHRVVLDGVNDEFELTFDYCGELSQDVAAGEREGQIHNVLMAAHIGTEGIFLVRAGGWYPVPYQGPEAPAAGELALYRLAVDPVEGMELVASAPLVQQAPETPEAIVWKSERPLDGLALVGGPHTVKRRTAGNVELALHYSQPEDMESRGLIERHTDLFLDAAESYLERYQPLVGPFPSRRFTIVENFFSSGFAFPEFTLLSRRLLEMGPRALHHGYLDHELLHSWWGNSIYVDPADGNWCEALTSYATNHYGYVLDEDREGARRYRRNACNTLSHLKPEDDQPLGTFGLEDGAGRGVGYSKGAMVFHMLARRIGQDNFWAAIRRLTAEHTGHYVNWETLQAVFEQESDVNLDRFFREWVRSGGAPNLELRQAAWHDDSSALEVTLDQGTTAFELTVPLRLVFDDGTSRDEIATVARRSAMVEITLDRPPASVVLDPDYHVFRKLHPGEIMPTSKTTRAAEQLLVVTPGPELSSFYERVIKRFDSEDEPKEITRREAGNLKAEELTRQSALIIGDAVRAALVQALLTRANCPITWHAGGFSIEGVDYDEPGHSVLCTLHHPDVPGAGITIYYGNTEDALGRSNLVLFYSNSLVAFETTATEVSGEKKYQSEVILRRDFETLVEIDVDR